MDKFLDEHRILKLTQEKIENLNKFKRSEENEFYLRIFPQGKAKPKWLYWRILLNI